jgi:hypothetical protein
MFVQSGQHAFEIVYAYRLLTEVRCFDPALSDSGRENDAEEAHATERCPEEVCVLSATCGDNLTGSEQNAHGFDAVTEAAPRVVCLSVNVIRNAARNVSVTFWPS